MPSPAQVVRPVAAEEAATGDRAHLVVQLRPADTSTAVAEPHELDARRGLGASGRRCVGSIDGVPSSPVEHARADWSGERTGQYEAQPDRFGLTARRRTWRPESSGSRRWDVRPIRWAPIVGRSPAGPEGGLSTDFIHQVIHTNGRSVNARAVRAWAPVTAARRDELSSPGPVAVRIQRWSASRSRPSNGSSASSRQPSRSTQSASDATAADAGDPDRRLLHAAEERLEPELARPLQHPLGRTDPAALGQLDVDARHDVRPGRRGPRYVTALSSATIGIDERSWSQPRSR